MESILTVLQQSNFLSICLFGMLVNVVIFCCSIGLYLVLSRFLNSGNLGEKQPITQSDISLSAITVVCNTVVFVLGVILWQNGFIELSADQSWLRVLAEVLFMTVVMDFLMYAFHRLVHALSYFRVLHARHHEHESTNMLSLFVLHPVESIGFGLMMLVVVCVFPLSAVGISLYLLLNSVWGTIGHLHSTVLPPSWIRFAKCIFLCTSEFHYLHHRNPGYNFGFYFSVWDVVLATLHPDLHSSSSPGRKKTRVSEMEKE